MAAILGIILLGGCGKKDDLPPPPIPLKTLKGRFIPRYLNAPTEFQDDIKLAKRNRFLQHIANDLNNKLALPVNVNVALGACRDRNSYYNSKTHTITLCYEMLRDIDSVDFGSDTSDNLNEQTYCILSVVYHEVGHALTDILGLHRQASIEDMSDRFSTWLMTVSSRSDRAKYYAQYFNIIASRGEEGVLHDRHLLNRQRRYNALCLVYGSNVKKYSSLVDDDLLPKERADGCSAEWQGVDQYWREALKDYLKKDLRISFRRNYRFQNEAAADTQQKQANPNLSAGEISPERVNEP